MTSVDRSLLLSQMDEDLILEALPAAWFPMIGKPRRPKKHPFRALGRFAESGWGVAIISGIVALGVLVAVILAGQKTPDNPPVIGPGGNDSHQMTESETEAVTLSSEESAVRAFADRELLTAYPALSAIDLSSFRITVSEHVSKAGTFTVRYRYDLCDLPTDETYTVRLIRTDSDASFTLDECSGVYTGQYTQFHRICSTARMEEARAELDKQTDPQYDAVSYLGIDQAGNLILQAEQIVDIITPGSLLGQEGCGIDHDHKFYNIIVCSPDDPPYQSGEDETAPGSSNASDPMSFSYTIKGADPQYIHPGMSFTITTIMTNRSDAEQGYVGSETARAAYFSLIPSGVPDGKPLDIGELPMTDDNNPHSIAAGETVVKSFTCQIPADAPAGDYDLHVYCLWNSQWSETFERAITITESGPIANIRFADVPTDWQQEVSMDDNGNLIKIEAEGYVKLAPCPYLFPKSRIPISIP